MANYLLLYTGGVEMPESGADTAAAFAEWGAWYGKLGDSVVDAGKPFMPAAKTVDSDGTVTDGPVGTMATGYTIVSADSLDSAAEKAQGCPVLKSGGKITVYEGIDMGM